VNTVVFRPSIRPVLSVTRCSKFDVFRDVFIRVTWQFSQMTGIASGMAVGCIILALLKNAGSGRVNRGRGAEEKRCHQMGGGSELGPLIMGSNASPKVVQNRSKRPRVRGPETSVFGQA
jgi:hypothetical protein